MKICDKRKLALASKNHKLIARYKRLFGNLDLRGADLSNLDLCDANLRDADLRRANMRGANMSDANLGGANLRGADLRGANLNYAKLGGTNLSYAKLVGAKTDNISINSGSIFYSLQCPEEGSFVAWKKCMDDVIVKLLIPEDARRSSATSRKCRAEFVDVLDVIGADIGISQRDSNVKYIKGERVHCDNWTEDRWVECGGGIHFFLTRDEAESF